MSQAHAHSHGLVDAGNAERLLVAPDEALALVAEHGDRFADVVALEQRL